MNILQTILQLFRKRPQYSLGAKLSPFDYRDIPISAVQAPVEIPDTYFTDISKLPVQNQLAHGSCVGQATGNAIDVIGDSDIVASRRYIYAMSKQLDGYDGQGTYPRVAASVLKNIGVASDKDVANDNTLTYKDFIDIPELDREKTIYNRVKGYAWVNVEDSQEMATAVYKNKVMTVSLAVGDFGTMHVKPGNFGYHYVMVYGYEKVGGEYYFYFRNSWGEQWGNKGNGVFKYSDFKGKIFDAIVFTDIPQELIEKAKNQQYRFMSDLRQGTRSDAVKKLQQRLWALGYIGETMVTGYFGGNTLAAVKMYQKDRGITQTGIVGPITRKSLNGGTMTLIQAIAMVESGSRLGLIGDRHLKDMAYGPLQIRKPCVDDVNKHFGTTYKAEDALNSWEVSTDIFNKYMQLYANEKALGRKVTDEDRARIWNAGPRGWVKNGSRLDIAASRYWAKVRSLLQ